jgi:peptidoglycan/LPS O-acetylase OafA/YrhL
MTSQNPGRLHGLDTLRTLAIVLVMIFHCHGYALPVLVSISRFGWMGVDLFFVLSGYLIGSQLLRPYARGQQPSLRNFYWRRAVRVLPAYWTVLALYLAWPHWREADNMSPLWQYLTFTYNLFVDYDRNRAFSHVWSLCVEEQFYLVLPLLVVLLFRKPSLRRTIIAASIFFIAGVVLRTLVMMHMQRSAVQDPDHFGIHYIEHIYYPTWSRMDGLLAGVLLATTQVFRPAAWERFRRNGWPLLALALTCITASCWLFYDRFTPDNPLELIGTAIGLPLLSFGLSALVMSSMGNGPLGRWKVPGASLGAALAFSYYLTHKEVLNLCETYLPKQYGFGTWVGFAIFSCASLLVASLLYLLVEKPCLRLRDKRWGHAESEVLRDPAL